MNYENCSPSFRCSLTQARASVREGAWRFSLPFGVISKQKSFAFAVQKQVFAPISTIVVQDSRILYPPEFIFSVYPGDCVGIQIPLDENLDAIIPSIEHLVLSHEPPLIVIAGSSDFVIDAEKIVLDVISSLKKRSTILSDHINLGGRDIEGCCVDSLKRRVKFLS